MNSSCLFKLNHPIFNLQDYKMLCIMYVLLRIKNLINSDLHVQYMYVLSGLQNN